MPAAHTTPFSRPLALAMLALTLIAPVIAFTVAAPARAATHAVTITDGAFSPASLAVAPGDTVTWTNQDDRPHTVTAANGAFDSGNLEPGASFSFTFTDAGTTGYACSYHPEMQAAIVAGASRPAPAPAAPPQPSGGSGTAAQPPAAGGGDATTQHAGGHEAGAQPDTAMPAPADLARWLPALLIGLGLVAFAFGLIPMRGVRAEPVPPIETRTAGWRR